MKEHYVIVCLRGDVFDCVISHIYHSPDEAQAAVVKLKQEDKKGEFGEYTYRICTIYETTYTS